MEVAPGDDESGGTLLDRARALYEQVLIEPTAPASTRPAGELAELARKAGDPESRILILRALAHAARSGLGTSEAKSLLDTAAGIARRSGLARQFVQVLLSRSGVSQELGRMTAAQRDLDTVRPLLEPPERSDFYLQQAALHHNRGQFGAAARMYTSVLADPLASPRVKAMTANNLSLIDVMLGALSDAVTHGEAAARFAEECEPPVRAGVASNRSWVAMQAGRLTASLEQFDRAAELFVAAGLPLGGYYLNYVDALIELRLLPEAQEATNRALAELERAGAPLMLAEGQVRRARLALLLGDPREAELAADAAGGYFTRQRRREWAAQSSIILVEAQTVLGSVTPLGLTRIRRAANLFEKLNLDGRAVEAHLVAGRAGLALHRDAEALTHFRRAHELAAGSAPVLVRLKGAVAGALADLVQDRPTSVLRRCRLGLADLARHRNTFASLELRVLASGHGAELGRLGLGVLLRTGSAANVFTWLEQTRAAALIAVAPIASAEMDDELVELRSVQAELASMATPTDDQTDSAGRRTLLGRQAAIEQRIRRATWTRQNTAGRHPSIESPAALRARLDGRTLVEYGVHDGRLIAAVLERHRTRLVPLGPLTTVQSNVELLLFALRRLSSPARSIAGQVAARAGADAALAALHQALFEGLDLPPDLPLVVIPTGALQRVPWSALRRAPVAVAPSASVWASTDRVGPSSGPVVLVAGPELPGAREEVAGLSGLHRSPTVLLPPASTVAAVTRALDGAGLAHLACHGHLRSDNPSFSALQLSDGALTVHEMEVRGIAPHRMVLASCNSAADRSYEGNEVLGFVSALIARGTAGLVASIVVIPDAAAMPVMEALHRQILRGDRLSDALFSARATADPDSPADFVSWCAFNAYGAA